MLGGSPGLVVVGGHSCSKGREFESRHNILDGHFFTYIFVVKFVMCVWKDENKWKRARVGRFFKKIGQLLEVFGLFFNSTSCHTDSVRISLKNNHSLGTWASVSFGSRFESESGLHPRSGLCSVASIRGCSTSIRGWSTSIRGWSTWISAMTGVSTSMISSNGDETTNFGLM